MASTRIAAGLVKAKIFDLDEIQFFGTQASVFTRESFTKHAMGLTRETKEQIIDTSLRRYCHFSEHNIVAVQENEGLLYAQQGDKPLQAFTFESLWLDKSIQTCRKPFGWTQLFNQGVVLDPFTEPSQSFFSMREAQQVLVVLPTQCYYRNLLLEALRNLQLSKKDRSDLENTVRARIKVISPIEVKDFEFQLSRGELKSISRKEITFQAPEELFKINCEEFDRIICPIVADEPAYTDENILYAQGAQNQDDIDRQIDAIVANFGSRAFRT